MIIRKIGFKENYKCNKCDLMAWYMVDCYTLCQKHFDEYDKLVDKYDLHM